MVAASQNYCKELKNFSNINIELMPVVWINLFHWQSVEYLVTSPVPVGPDFSGILLHSTPYYN